MLCLLQPAFASDAPISKQIEIKTSLLDDAQQQVQDLTSQIDSKEKEKKLIEMDIKRFSLDVKRLGLDTQPNEATKAALNTAQFEVKRAEFNLEKNTETLKKLYADRDAAREQKRSFALQIEQLQEQRRNGTDNTEKQPADQVRLAQIEKPRQQQAAEVEKQRLALQAKLNATPATAAAKQAAEQERQRLAEMDKQKQLAADKARQEQAVAAAKQAAEQERLRLAEIDKQKQLAADKARQEQAAAAAKQAAEQERQRLAEIDKQKQLAADKARQEQAATAAKQAAEQEQAALTANKAAELEQAKLAADKERAVVAARQAEESARQAQELAEKNRLADIEREKLRLQAQAKKQAQMPKQETTVQVSGLNQTLDKKGAPAKVLTPQQQAQKKFIESSNTLPPAESALTLAMARSLDAAAEQPALGNNPNLEVANPIGSARTTVGVMKYLGNNQYMLEMRVTKGKQQFSLGKHLFFKNIPEHFDGIRCLLLVDARNKDNPTFQLVVAGG